MVSDQMNPAILQEGEGGQMVVVVYIGIYSVSVCLFQIQISFLVHIMAGEIVAV